MQRQAWIAVALAGLAGVMTLVREPARRGSAPVASSTPATLRPLGPAVCPAGSLEHGGVCLPVQAMPAPSPRRGEREVVPRRPDLPPALSAYRLPASPGESAGTLPCGAGLEPALVVAAARGTPLREFLDAAGAERGPTVVLEGEEVAIWWVTRPGAPRPASSAGGAASATPPELRPARRWLLAVAGTAAGGTAVGDAGRLCLTARAADGNPDSAASLARALASGVVVDPRNLLDLAP